MIDHFGDDSNITGEMMRGVVIRQPFYAEGSVLRYLLIAFATYQRRNLCNVTIDICQENVTMRTETISASQLQDNGYHRFNTGLKLETGKEYEIRVYSSNGTYGNAVTTKHGEAKHDNDLFIRIGNKRKKAELCCTLMYDDDVNNTQPPLGICLEENHVLREGPPELSIVIPTATQFGHLKVCLDSIRSYTSSYEVIVVSNTPDKDYSLQVQRLLHGYPNHVYISYPRYAGYVATCNAGAAVSRGEYLCILNDDTMAGKRWADKMISTLKSDDRIAQVGPSMTYIDKTFACSLSPTKHPYIEGWCFVIPRHIYEQFGLFDPKLDFAYCEDSDFSTMLINNGYKIKGINANIRHLGTQTSKQGGMKKITDGCESNNKRYLCEKWKDIL